MGGKKQTGGYNVLGAVGITVFLVAWVYYIVFPVLKTINAIFSVIGDF